MLQLLQSCRRAMTPRWLGADPASPWRLHDLCLCVTTASVDSPDARCGEGPWWLPHNPATPNERSFRLLVGMGAAFTAMSRHATVSQFEDITISHTADDVMRSRDPLRAYPVLVRMTLRRRTLAVLASSPDVLVWCHQRLGNPAFAFAPDSPVAASRCVRAWFDVRVEQSAASLSAVPLPSGVGMVARRTAKRRVAGFRRCALGLPA